MAQTTAAESGSNYKIEVSYDGSSWTDISGVSNNVEPSGGEQQIGTQFTAAGDAPVVVNSNKNDAVKVKCSILYTETSGEGFDKVYSRYVGATKTIYFRYSPRGGTTGQKRYVASNAANSAVAVPIESCLPPKTDAGSGDPLMAEFTVVCPKLYQEAVP